MIRPPTTGNTTPRCRHNQVKIGAPSRVHRGIVDFRRPLSARRPRERLEAWADRLATELTTKTLQQRPSRRPQCLRGQ